MSRRRRQEEPLRVDTVCDALNHLSGSVPRVRLAGIEAVARDVERVARQALDLLQGPRPELCLAVLAMGLERGKRRTEEIIRRLAELAPEEP